MVPETKDAKTFFQSLQTKALAVLDVRRAFVVLLLTCACFFFSISYSIRKSYVLKFIEVIDTYNNSGILLDTEGCKIPKFDPFDESVKHLIKLRKPYVCKGEPTFMITQPNGTVILNLTVLDVFYKLSPDNISCFYNAIYRTTEPEGHKKENFISFSEPKVLKFGVPLEEEFIKVECNLGTKIFTQYISFIPIKPKVKRIFEFQNHSSDALNVILIGIDSVSKLNFLRHFKRTHDFLTRNLSAFEMKGYTKVGDNTFPNLVPLLTGHFIEHYWNESVKKTMFFDNLDFIWKLYSEKGYITFYAEDSPYTGTFNYLKRGFKDPPTDYYFRTMALAMEKSELKKHSSHYCLNSQLETDIFYGYLKDFLKTFKNNLSFSFTMVSTLTHDYFNDAGYADEPTYNLLKELWSEGMMNRSMIVVFSDHGIRFGAIRETYIGKFEERMPFMYLKFPEWFLEKNKGIAKNLRENQNRLITLFDIHATLYHILNPINSILEKRKAITIPNGLSLLNKIPSYRTCEMAKILPHWCPCHVYNTVDPNSQTAIKAASAVIKEINRQLKPFSDLCAHLQLEKVTDARLGQTNDIVLRFVRHENDVIGRHVVYGDKTKTLSDFWITLKAHPGSGMFESTVRYDAKNEKFKVLEISRINKYGKQSKCIRSQKMKIFCYCKIT